MADLEAGTVIGGDFEVQSLLQKGGMGAVYLAVQRSTMRQRALKVMHTEIVLDEAYRARFAQEARVASRIDSDHVVEVIAAGVDEVRGFPWLVMELLEGEELGARVERGQQLTPPEAAEALAQLYHGVARAHAAGIVHRDLKPENLFLSRARRAGVPFTLKILDFGIAKLLEDAKTHATTQALGTPLWMAPEQSDQRSVVSPATDVWALALIAFWVLTGRHYWLTALSPTATLTGLLREILVEPMPAASLRAAELGASVPIGFDEWFAACTDRDPRARIQTADLAWERLGQLLRSDGVPERWALTGTAPASVPPALRSDRPLASGPATASDSAPMVQLSMQPHSEPSLTADAAPRGSDHAHGYFYPVVYPFSEPGCARELWWVALINYLPGLNLLLLRGFRLELTQRMLRGQAPLFPPPAHMGSFLFQGALLWTMTGLYLIPPLALMAFTGIRGLSSFLGDLLTLAGIVLGLTNVSLWDFVVRELWTSLLAAAIDSVWAILSLPLYRAAMIHYAVTGKVGAFFAVHTNIGFIVRHARAFANLYLFSFILNAMIALAGLVLASTVVGALLIPLFALPVYYWTTGYEYGLLAQEFARDLADPKVARGQLRWLLVPAGLALLVHACAPDPLDKPDLAAISAGAQPAGCGAPFGRSGASSGVSATAALPTNTTTAAGSRSISSRAPQSERPQVVPSASASAAEDAATTELRVVQTVVVAYYADLSADTFDASEHFAPRIERYISMQGTSPAAINAYINGPFRSQFKKPKFTLEPGSLEREASGSYVYDEHSEYYFVAKKRQVSQRYKVRVRVVDGKIAFLHQFQRLPSAAQ